VKCSGEAAIRRLCVVCTYNVAALHSLSADTVFREHLPTASSFSSTDKKKVRRAFAGRLCGQRSVQCLWASSLLRWRWCWQYQPQPALGMLQHRRWYWVVCMLLTILAAAPCRKST